MRVQLTHLTTATVLIELAGLRILTDPALDAAGTRYDFGFGTRSTKLEPPALQAEQLGRIDLALVSHDQHADNLDDAGRAVLSGVPKVLTTIAGARRLKATGMKPWERIEIPAPQGPISITATPARHGPPLSRPLVGDVIGFYLQVPNVSGGLYISGDTVWFNGIEEVARRFEISVALLHVGGVRFPISGPLRYTFDGPEAARTAVATRARTVVPIHYDGWTHFKEPRSAVERAFSAAGIDDRVRWLEKGVPGEVDL